MKVKRKTQRKRKRKRKVESETEAAAAIKRRLHPSELQTEDPQQTRDEVSWPCLAHLCAPPLCTRYDEKCPHRNCFGRLLQLLENDECDVVGDAEIRDNF